VGTDLALKSMESIREKVSACILATCCHGICEWQHYVGRDDLRQLMEQTEISNGKISGGSLSFGPAEFDLLRRWCAASVANAPDAEKDTTVNTGDASNEGSEDPLDMEHEPCSPAGKATRDSDDASSSSSATSVSSIVRALDLRCGIQGLGRACQRLIDYGRYRYLRNQMFPVTDDINKKVLVNLTHYVGPDVTPQNAALWAFRETEIQQS